MQPIARDGLTDVQVRGVVEAIDLRVDFGVDLLDADDVFLEDIGADVDGGTVDSNGFRDVHRTCHLQVARTLGWESQRVRPWMTLTDQVGGDTFRANLGVYLPSTPERPAGETPATYDVECYDKTVLLDVPVGRTFVAAGGDGTLAVIVALFDEIGETHVRVAGVGDDVVLPADRLWPLDEKNTYRRVINDLLDSIGYRSVWADWDGWFVLAPYQQPADRPIEWTFDTTADRSNVGEDRTAVADVFDVPNEWVFVRDDPELAAPTEGAGVYTVTNQDDGETSIDSRRRTIRRVVHLQAATQASLETQGDRIATEDRRVSRYVKMTCGPLPLLWHFDIVTIADAELDLDGRWQGWTWKLPLNGDDMSLEWRSA